MVPRPARLAALAPLALAACGGAPEPQAPPNVVILVLDTLRPDHLGTYGYDRPTSPHLDALAEHGVVFTEAQSPAPWTAPTLISMVTGLDPAVHGVTAFPEPLRLADEVPTLAELLRDRGYATAAFTEGGYASGVFGLDQGFDRFEMVEGDYHADGSGPGSLAHRVDGVLDWLDARPDAPFLLFFHTFEPHLPYEIEDDAHLVAVQPDYDPVAAHARLDEVVARWNADEELGLDELRVLARHAHHCRLQGGTEEPRDREHLLELAADPASLRLPGSDMADPFLVDLYDAEVRYTDAQMQRLLDGLDAHGLTDDTVIAVVSDHGEAFGENGDLGHGRLLHDPVLDVVLLLADGRGRLAPGRVDALVSTLDLTPTLLELVGVDAADLDLQGRSLVPVAAGAPGAGLAFSGTLAVVDATRDTLRTPRWRYVLDGGATAGRLYDRDDPTLPRVDVADDHPDVAAALHAKLLERRAEGADLRARLGGTQQAAEVDAALQQALDDLGYTGD